MTFDFTDYLPPGITAAFAAVAFWVFRDHTELDATRFKSVDTGFKDFSEKLDEAIKTQAQNHAEILKILLEQSRG